MSRVDVIVPCYNYGRFLRQCVESVLSQEGVDVRVLIIDDCSTDDSELVGRAIAAEDSRVEYRRHAVNRGHHPTYNEGIDWLSGTYCILLSADDILTPGALSRAAAVMDSRPEVVLTHGKCIRTRTPGLAKEPLLVTTEVTIQPGPEFVRKRCEFGRNMVETPTAIGRTSVQKAIGHYRAELPHAGDMEMWLRYAAHGSVAYVHAHQAYYRTHDRNMSITYNGIRDLLQVKLAFDSFFEAHGDILPDRLACRRMAYRKMAKEAFGSASDAFISRDAPSFRSFCRFAREVDPRTMIAPRWTLLRFKHLLGIKVWRTLKRMPYTQTLSHSRTVTPASSPG